MLILIWKLLNRLPAYELERIPTNSSYGTFFALMSSFFNGVMEKVCDTFLIADL